MWETCSIQSFHTCATDMMIASPASVFFGAVHSGIPTPDGAINHRARFVTWVSLLPKFLPAPPQGLGALFLLDF